MLLNFEADLTTMYDFLGNFRLGPLMPPSRIRFFYTLLQNLTLIWKIDDEKTELLKSNHAKIVTNFYLLMRVSMAVPDMVARSISLDNV